MDSERKRFLIARVLLAFVIILMMGCTYGNTSTGVATHNLSESPAYPSLIAASSTTMIVSTPSPIATKLVLSATPENVHDLIISLIKDNGRCSFPCIWGQLPGKTDASSVQTFFKSFRQETNDNSLISVDTRETEGLLYFKSIEGDIEINYNLTYKNVNGILQSISFHSYPIQGGRETYAYGNSIYNELFGQYFLAPILSMYGEPALLLIRIYLSDVMKMPITPFQLVLFYPEKGILIEYEMEAKSQSTYYEGCPQNSVIRITTFDPKPGVDLSTIAPGGTLRISAANIGTYKNMTDATGMSLSDFIQTYSGKSNAPCIKTPKNIWSIVP